MKNILVIVFSLILLCGCQEKKNQTIETVMAEKNYIIVDVRTKEEYDSEHVVGAINIPYDEINASSNLDKNKTIVVYCQSGKRSSIAYNTLKNLGYDVFDLGAYNSITLEKE